MKTFAPRLTLLVLVVSFGLSVCAHATTPDRIFNTGNGNFALSDGSGPVIDSPDYRHCKCGALMSMIDKTATNQP